MMTYIKIHENGEDHLFSTDQHKGLGDILALLNEAIREERPRHSISDHILSRSEPLSQMSEAQWQAITREHQATSSESKLAEVDVDRSYATISLWGKPAGPR